MGFNNDDYPEGALAYAPYETVEVEDPTELAQNTWNHLAMTYDGDAMRLYVNGELTDTVGTSKGAISSSGDLRIGCNQEWEDFSTGKIDEVHIYERALDAGEIAADKAAALQTPSAGPVAAYSFDEDEGETANDPAGGHDGAIEGAEWTKGKYGAALKFDGEDDCVTVPDSPGLQLSEEFTLEAWVKPEGGDKSNPIFFKETENHFSYALSLGFNNDDYPEGALAYAPYETVEVEDPTELAQRTWNHLAMTYDGDSLRLYVNGELTDSVGTSGAISSSGDLRIGCNEQWEDFFTGKIDNIRIYERALDGGEVGADKAVAIQAPSAGPVAVYSFDENEGEVAGDPAGGHDGAIEGAEWTRGKYGAALKFDGEDDCVTIPDAPDLQLGEEFTLEAWVKPEGGDKSNPIFFKETEYHFSYALSLGFNNDDYPEGALAYAPYETVEVEDPTELAQNTWNHLAMTYDGDAMRLYVNGELTDTVGTSKGAISSSGDLRIGCNQEWEDFSTGKIDEVHIYERALDAGEIAADKAAALQTPSAGPVAAYSFDEDEGETANDPAGGHDGAIEGAEWTKGKYGAALKFDGEDDCVTVPDSPGLQLSEEFTLEAWVKPEGGDKSNPIFFKETENHFSYALSLGFNNDDYPEGALAYAPYETVEVEDPTELAQNTWNHLAMTYDGDAMRLYVNGELTDTVGTSKGAISSSGDLRIGCNQEWEDFSTGKIDEVHIYERALDAGEIAADKAAALQTPSAGPVAAYSFDEDEGETANDPAGGHDGAIEGAEWTKGKYGAALKFDGEDDCVTVPDSPGLQLSEEFTLEAWVKPEGGDKSEPVLFKETPYFTGYSLYYGLFEEGHIEGVIGQEGFVYKTATDPEGLTPNIWSHVALTFDGARMRLYVNGELVDSAKADGAQATSGDLSIGCSQEFEDEFEGKIDEVHIYERALDGSEIRPDLTPPSAPNHFSAIYDAEEAEAEVSWEPSSDPPFSDGHPGSGIAGYAYRYRLEAGEWSQWQPSLGPAFGVSGASENEVIAVQGIAKDRAGNTSPLRFAKVIAQPGVLTPEEVGEEDANETGQAPLDPEPAENAFDLASSPIVQKDAYEEFLCDPNPSPCGKYNGRDAAAYAVRWNLLNTTNDEARQLHNQQYGYFGGNGGDCTNFASQALKAGGMKYMRAHGRNSPDATEPSASGEFEKGQGSWWSYFQETPLMGGSGYLQRTFEGTESFTHADVLYEHLLDYGLGRVLGPEEVVRPGDLVFYNLVGLDLSAMDHSQIVVGVTPNKIWVSQHSPGYRHTLRYVLRKNNTPDHKLFTDWTYRILRPIHTAANIEG